MCSVVIRYTILALYATFWSCRIQTANWFRNRGRQIARLVIHNCFS